MHIFPTTFLKIAVYSEVQVLARSQYYTHARTQIELKLPGIAINWRFVVISNMHRLFLIFMHSPSDLVLKDFCLFGQPHRVRFTFAQQLTKRKRKQISHSYRLLGQKGIL